MSNPYANYPSANERRQAEKTMFPEPPTYISPYSAPLPSYPTVEHESNAGPASHTLLAPARSTAYSPQDLQLAQEHPDSFRLRAAHKDFSEHRKTCAKNRSVHAHLVGDTFSLRTIIVDDSCALAFDLASFNHLDQLYRLLDRHDKEKNPLHFDPYNGTQDTIDWPHVESSKQWVLTYDKNTKFFPMEPEDWVTRRKRGTVSGQGWITQGVCPTLEEELLYDTMFRTKKTLEEVSVGKSCWI